LTPLFRGVEHAVGLIRDNRSRNAASSSGVIGWSGLKSGRFAMFAVLFDFAAWTRCKMERGGKSPHGAIDPGTCAGLEGTLEGTKKGEFQLELRCANSRSSKGGVAFRSWLQRGGHAI
jgi:hypothetical protein